MTRPPDQPFDEESLLHALRAPGSADELGAEDQYVAMFREARDAAAPAPVPLVPRRRRAVSRLGAGSAFVVVLAVGGSAAAAYTNNLPEPIQRFAHRALGPVAPPAPQERRPRATDPATSAPTTSTSPTPTPDPTPTPTPTPTPSARPSPTHKPSPKPTPSATPTPSSAPSPSPTPTTAPTEPTPTPTPSTTPTTPPVVTPPVAASVSIAGSTHKVEPGESVTFAGTVSATDGRPVRRARVALQSWDGSHWATVGSSRADASGQVTLVLPPVSATTAVRLRTARVHSARWRVTLHPEVSVTSAPGETEGTVVITATVVGGQTGDRVELVTKAGQVATGTLDAGGSVSFAVTPTARRTGYGVLLPATSAHSADHATVTVVVPAHRSRQSDRSDPQRRSGVL